MAKSIAIGMRTRYRAIGFDSLPNNPKHKKSKRCGVCSKKFSKSSGLTKVFKVQSVYVCNECAPNLIGRINQAIWLNKCNINNP